MRSGHRSDSMAAFGYFRTVILKRNEAWYPLDKALDIAAVRARAWPTKIKREDFYARCHDGGCCRSDGGAGRWPRVRPGEMEFAEADPAGGRGSLRDGGRWKALCARRAWRLPGLGT